MERFRYYDTVLKKRFSGSFFLKKGQRNNNKLKESIYKELGGPRILHRNK